jgi:HK97 gp10 family phage protein
MKRVPVKTGQLQQSIYSRISEWVAEVGAEASYAVFVELGTRYMRARPFLFPAVQECLPRLESVICEAIESAKREAGL